MAERDRAHDREPESGAADALAAVDSEKVVLGLTDGNSSCLVRAAGAATSKYVVMPMRL